MEFTYNNRNYDLPSLKISIGGETFDVDKRATFDKHGEAIRLFLELLPHNGGFTEDAEGNQIPIPARVDGINILTDTFQNIVDFLNTPLFPISESNKSLIRRVLAWRFPTEFDTEISKVSQEIKTEYTLIKNSTKSIDFLGEAGFFDTIRRDGTKV